jgi:mannose-6-phosphate isomerase
MDGAIGPGGGLRSLMPTTVKLDSPIQRCAWGSLHAIAEVQGRPAPGAEPEVELWIGDHPRAPSSALVGDRPVKLPDWIAADPEAGLGPGARQCYGPQLRSVMRPPPAGLTGARDTRMSDRLGRITPAASARGRPWTGSSRNDKDDR